jgi:predicted GIY-YIG superfamily endonuclease
LIPVVYRAYDANENVLYIGASCYLKSRLAAHKWGSPWMAKAQRIEARRYKSWSKALDAEAYAIFKERPAFNRQCAIHRLAKMMRVFVRTERQGRPPPPFPSDFIGIVAARGMTMKGVALVSGIPLDEVRALANPKYDPSVKTLVAVAKAIGMKPSDIREELRE